MTDYEKGSAETPPDEALQITLNQLRSWQSISDNLDNDINQRVSHHYCRWLIDLWGEDALIRGAREFSGEELPSSLQPLVAYEFDDQVVFSNNNTVHMEHAPRGDYIPGSIPNWDELRKLPFAAAKQKIKDDPKIHQNIQFPGSLVLDRIIIDYRPDPAAYHWGLEFDITPLNTTVYPYGDRGYTHDATEYARTAKPSSAFAITAATLAYLCTRYSTIANSRTVSTDLLHSFEGRVKGTVPVQVNAEMLRKTFSPPPEDAVLIQMLHELIADGVIGSDGRRSD